MNDRRGAALSPRLWAAAGDEAVDGLSIAALTRRRDLLSAALTSAGFAVVPPEGTSYLFTRWPKGDPEALWNALADRVASCSPAA